MNQEQFQRVKAIFAEALAKPDSERPAYLAAACAEDAAIRAEVETLLRQNERPGGILDGDTGSKIRQIIEDIHAQGSPLQPAATLPLDAAAARSSDFSAWVDSASEDGLTHSSSPDDEGRFHAGTVIAERYRLLNLLGRGGMGEVYRADDLRLNQPVALKFLPRAYVKDAKWLERFHHEVRMARQVTHANVCRVFDIGEFAGDVFITMEYIDGENLAALLRRIGRFPEDRAIRLSRELCNGLAAAHERGVLHRDLKPANIMIDGRGHVKITDFGLAAPAEALTQIANRAGTPAYMSPEQFLSQRVSVRSDIYSLGLVMYELFTGRPAFAGKSIEEYRRLHGSVTARNPSFFDPNLDPLIGRVILRMLEKDPQRRPANVLMVAAALPGGDPLAAALAVGETPSPEIVAASGGRVGISPRRAALAVTAIFIGLILAVIVSGHFSWMALLPSDKPPSVLVYNTQQMLEHIGITDPVGDAAHGFLWSEPLVEYLSKQTQRADRRTLIAHFRPSPLQFWYRQSVRPLVAAETGGNVTVDIPADSGHGMFTVVEDLDGRLLYLDGVPRNAWEHEQHLAEKMPAADATSNAIEPIKQPDWKALFAAAGLDLAAFQPAAPTLVPTHFADLRRAWTGIWPHTAEPVRIEAAGCAGIPVFFDIVGPWGRQDPQRITNDIGGPFRINVVIQLATLLGLLGGGVILVWHNLRTGRGDRNGAFRLAVACMILGISWWALESHHVLLSDVAAPTTPVLNAGHAIAGTDQESKFVNEFRLFIHGIGQIAFPVGLVWLFYLALEPTVRRRKPELLITWSRLLAGQFFDSGVGRDLLLGTAAGAWIGVLGLLRAAFPGLVGLPGSTDSGVFLGRILSLRWPATMFLSGALTSIMMGLIIAMLLTVIGMLVRNRIAMWAGFLLIFVLATSPFNQTGAIEWVFQLAIGLGLLFVLTRFGLVALIAALLVQRILTTTPITYDFSRWFSGTTLLGLLTILAIAAFGLVQALRTSRLSPAHISTSRAWLDDEP